MPKILLIEDEKMLAEMYKDRFATAGVEVTIALTAKEALAILKQMRPDLILLDILLPKENGLSLLQKIRKTRKDLDQVPVIAFSNYDEPRAKKEASALGVKAYLIKTQFTPKEIVEKIKSYLA